MIFPVRAKPFVTQMRRGRLPAGPCRHHLVDGLERPSGRNASPSGITPPTIMSPTRCRFGSWTEIRPSARAHAIPIPDRAPLAASRPGPFTAHQSDQAALVAADVLHR